MGQITKIDVDGKVSLVDKDSYLERKSPELHLESKRKRRIQEWRSRSGKIKDFARSIISDISILHSKLETMSQAAEMKDTPKTLIHQIDSIVNDLKTLTTSFPMISSSEDAQVIKDIEKALKIRTRFP